MTSIEILLIFAVLINVLFAVLTYIHSKKEITVLFYALVSFFAGIWAVATLLMHSQPSLFIFSLAAVLHYIGGNLAYLCFFWLAALYPVRTFKSIFFPATITLINFAIIAFIPFRDFFFLQLRLDPMLSERIVLNPIGYFVFVSYLTGVFVLGLILLLLKRTRVDIQTRNRLTYILLAMLVAGTLGIVFNLLLPWLGNFSYFIVNPILVTIALTAFGLYNILHNRIFDIRIIATELLVITMWIATLFNALYAQTTQDQIVQGTTFAVTLLIGYFLIRSVQREVEQREELQKLSDELAHANEKLKKLDKAKSEFISIASHQLRTPLTAIKGYLSLVLEDTYGKVDEAIRKPLGNVYISNERLIRLVNDLLSISRIESGKIKLELAKINIKEMTQSVIAELRIKAQEKNLQLILMPVDASIQDVQIDEEKMRNVILNIIDNAIRYTPTGSITTKIEKVNTKLHISITDTGEGMTKEEISGLFQSFTRGNAGTKFSTEGAGLGLYIARQFVEMHHGKVWAESEGKGKGSTFHIEVPLL
jgi:signal transduction histidine kinase